MSTSLNNTYNFSELVSLDIMNLLGKMESIFLKYTGNHGVSTFDDDSYVPGQTVSYQVSGIPPVSRSDVVTFTPYEQRQLFITADARRWQKSVTSAFNLTDDLFYLKPEVVTETISAPTLRALKEHWELEAAQYAIEHAPIIPSYGAAVDDFITFPNDGTRDTFNSTVINWLKKLRHDLILPLKSYSLVLNTMDYMDLSNSLVNIYNERINSIAIRSGAAPEQVSDFNNECSPYIGLHTNAGVPQDNADRGPLVMTPPTSDDNPTATITNNGTQDITLKAGDIIYYKAPSGQLDNGLHWIQNTVKRAVPDSRYAFVVTSDQYIASLPDTAMPNFRYEDVNYPIAAGGSAVVSLSHRPIADGYHQNVSRAITPTDEFYVLGDHYKNVAINPNFFMMKSFKIPKMNSTDYSYAKDSKTKIQMLVTQDRIFQEGARRGNVFDTTSLVCFGSVPQNLFTLPSGPNK